MGRDYKVSPCCVLFLLSQKNSMAYNSALHKQFMALIMKGRVTRQRIVDFALNVKQEESLEYYTDCFVQQGPALWRWWCFAMDQRKKQGLCVPRTWR
jgi:hypothetical protein